MTSDARSLSQLCGCAARGDWEGVREREREKERVRVSAYVGTGKMLALNFRQLRVEAGGQHVQNEHTGHRHRQS